MTNPIAHACATAWAHIATKTLADATPAELRACMQDRAVLAGQACLERLAAQGNLALTQQTLQDLNTAYQAALQQLRQEEKR